MIYHYRQNAANCLVSVVKPVHELSAFLGRFSQDTNMFRTFATDDEGRHEVEYLLAHVWSCDAASRTDERMAAMTAAATCGHAA
jgi:hypothetical protein